MNNLAYSSNKVLTVTYNNKTISLWKVVELHQKVPRGTFFCVYDKMISFDWSEGFIPFLQETGIWHNLSPNMRNHISDNVRDYLAMSVA